MNCLKVRLIHVVVAVFMLTLYSLAQTNAQAIGQTGNAAEKYQVYELGEVVVSGDRETFETPTTIAEVTGAEIENQNAENLGEAIQIVSGVYFRQGRAKQESYATVRGFEQDKVLILLDGIPIYQPYEGLVNLDDIPIQNIAKIKVVKGLSSPLYGPNAMGGVINIITKKGKESPLAEFEYKISEYNTHHITASHGWRTGNFSYFLGVSHKKSDGFKLAEDFTLPEDILAGMAQAPSPVPHTPIKPDSGVRDNSDYNRNSVTFTGSWDITPDNTLGLSLAYYDNEYGITPTAIYRETRRSGGTAYWYPRYWQFEGWKRTTVGLTDENRLSDTLRVRARVFFDDYKSVLNAYDDDTYSTQIRTAGAPSFDSEYDDYNAGFSLYAFYNRLEYHDIRLGASHKQDVHKSTYAFSDSPAEYEKLVAGTTSAAFEDIIALNDSLMLTLGASYDIFNQDERDQASGSETGDRIGTFNPQAGITYSPSPYLELYASAGKKTRFPTMRNLYADGVIGPLGNPDLDEERTYAYELGSKWRVNTVVNLEGALFYNDVRDLILFDNQIGRFEQYDKAEIYGAEVNLSAKLSSGVSGRIGYTCLVARNDDSVVTVETEYLPNDLVYTPDKIPYRPRHKIDISLNRSFAFGLNLHLNGSYVAGRIFYNHADPEDNTVFVAEKEKLDDYFLLNTRITYDFMTHHQLIFAVDNLLNEDYQELYLSPASGITGWMGYKFSL